MAHSGVQIQERPGLGKVLVATKDFIVGDLVLQENPLLRYSCGTDWGGLLRAFIAASAEVKEVVLGMYHPSIMSSDAHVVEALATARTLVQKPAFDHLTAETIARLILISNTNAHSYVGQNDVAYHEVMMRQGQSPDTTRLSALFDVASKAAHSCKPNVSYSSRHGPFMRYVATTSILTGQQITFSYIDALYTSDRATRRSRLMAEKQFFCRCDRCSGVDDVRGVHCRVSGCRGVSFHSDDAPATGPTAGPAGATASADTWTCSSWPLPHCPRPSPWLFPHSPRPSPTHPSPWAAPSPTPLSVPCKEGRTWRRRLAC